jgi:hypothetical protein
MNESASESRDCSSLRARGIRLTIAARIFLCKHEPFPPDLRSTHGDAAMTDAKQDIPGPEQLPELARDLSAMHVEPVPAEVDEAILEMARHSLGRPRRIGRLAPLGGVAAAIAITVWIAWPGAQRTPGPAAIVGDINSDGRVDILDAFALAKTLDARRHGVTGQALRNGWDVTGDGLIDRRDVDAIATMAVSITSNTQGGEAS